MLRGRVIAKALAALVVPCFLILILGVVFRVPAARAQTTFANLTGTVTDETAAVVPNVNITVMNTGTGFQRWAATNDDGYFVIPLIPPGTYTLSAEMPGFATVTINDLVLRASINSRVEIVLLPKSFNEAVDVIASNHIAASGNKIDITNGTTMHSVGNEQVISLPVLTTTLGRNTLGVLPFVVPGVTPAAALGSAQPETNLRGNQMSINGSRPSSISFYVEGGDNNDQELNQALAPLPNPDVLQEFTVITSSYLADLGRSSGGIVNAVIKSGANDYRGNVRHFLINEALNARGFFDPKVPLDRVNTFGGQIGGPIRLPGLFNGKSRSFFFFDYEGSRSHREALSALILPSDRERAGDFSEQPASSQPFDPLTASRFDGGVIPAERINPISRFYLDRLVPSPNDGEFTFRQLLRTEFRNDQFTLRLDHRVNANDSFSFTFLSSNSNVDAGTANLPKGSTTDSRARNHNAILRETHIFSARTVNQLTVTATRFVDSQRLIAPGATGIDPSQAGFTAIHPQRVDFLGVPSVSITGTDARVVTGQGTLSAKTSWQIKDDLSHTDGNHALRFGGEVRGFLQNASTSSNNGSFVFSYNALGARNAIADFLLGNPSTYVQTSGNTRYPRQEALYFYSMDDWHLRSNLTLNVGLRFELAPPLKDKLDQVSVFRPGAKSERFPNAPSGLLFVGDPDPVLGSVPRGAYPTDKNNLAPRLGLAYSPRPASGWLRPLFGEGKTAIRAGLGLFYDQTLGFNFTQFSFTQPFSVSETLDFFRIKAGGGTFANPFGSLPNAWPLDSHKATFSAAPQIQPFDPRFRTAYTCQYNLTIQRELPWALLLEVSYVGNDGFKLNRERELNVAPVIPGANTDVQQRRIYRQFGSIPSQESTGRARYDSFQTRLARRSAKLTFDISYVYGRALDNGSGPVSDSVTNPFRWARSAFDRTHNLVASYMYEFPAARYKGIAGRLIGGWQVAGITELRSGQPMDIYQSVDTTLTGAHAVGNPDFVGRYIEFDPRKFQTFTVNGRPVSGNFFFDPNVFEAVPLRTYKDARPGTLARNVFDGPGINLSSMSIIKRVRLTESRQITIRSDIRNVFNHAHFQLQSSTLRVNSPSFGEVLSAAPGRTIQLSLRYSF